MKRVRFGYIHADAVSFAQAIDHIAALVAKGEGGYVVTPNVDHVVLAENDASLRAAYAQASLSLVDGMPLLWLARAMGHALPEKVSGSDLLLPLLQRAASERWRVFFLGAAPGVAEQAAQRLQDRILGLDVVGTLSPAMGFYDDDAQIRLVLDELATSKPQLVLVALGCPTQELLMWQWQKHLAPAVCLGIGASLDFVVGVQKRSPTWMSKLGLEWVYRLANDPRRMAQRYLVRDRAIVGIAARMLRAPHSARAYEV